MGMRVLDDIGVLGVENIMGDVAGSNGVTTYSYSQDSGRPAAGQAMYATVVAMADIADLSGSQTVNGVTVSDGDYVFARVQTDPAEIGLYRVSSTEDWTKVAVPTGGILNVLKGDVFARSLWQYDGSVFSLIYGPRVIQNQTLFVSGLYGDDATAQSGRLDRMYKTFAAARTAAVAGDTIVVFDLSAPVDLVTKNNVKVVGIPDDAGRRPLFIRLIDSGSACTCEITDVDFDRNGASGVLNISAAASLVTLRRSVLKSNTFWGLSLIGRLKCEKVIHYHTGGSEAFSIGTTGELSGLYVKGDITVIAGGAQCVNQGVLTKFFGDFTGNGRLLIESTGAFEEIEVHVASLGNLAVDNKGTGRKGFARNTLGSGWRDRNGADTEDVGGEGAGNGAAGGRTIKGTGYEIGTDIPADNTGTRSRRAYGFSYTDEGLVQWPGVYTDESYGETGPGGLEGNNIIGSKARSPRGRTGSSLVNAVDVSIQNGNIPAHGIAGNTPAHVTDLVVQASLSTQAHAIFVQGNDHKFIGGSVAHLQGGSCVSVKAGDTGLSFQGVDLYTTGTNVGGAFAIKSDTGSLTTLEHTGTKNVDYAPEIVNTAFDPKPRADLASRYIDVSANLWDTTQNYIVLAELALQGGTIYSAGADIEVKIESRWIGGDANSSATYRISKAAAQVTQVGSWIIQLVSWHAAAFNVPKKSYSLFVLIKDQDSAYLCCGKDGGTNPGANKLIRFYVSNLDPTIPLLGEVVDSTHDVFTEADATIQESTEENTAWAPNFADSTGWLTFDNISGYWCKPRTGRLATFRIKFRAKNVGNPTVTFTTNKIYMEVPFSFYSTYADASKLQGFAEILVPGQPASAIQILDAANKVIQFGIIRDIANGSNDVYYAEFSYVCAS